MLDFSLPACFQERTSSARYRLRGVSACNRGGGGYGRVWRKVTPNACEARDLKQTAPTRIVSRVAISRMGHQALTKLWIYFGSLHFLRHVVTPPTNQEAENWQSAYLHKGKSYRDGTNFIIPLDKPSILTKKQGYWMAFKNVRLQCLSVNAIDDKMTTMTPQEVEVKRKLVQAITTIRIGLDILIYQTPLVIGR